MLCKHYWVCGQPEDGFVRSVCRKCGKVQRFETLISMEYRKAKATLDDKDWAYDGEHLPDPKTAGLH